MKIKTSELIGPALDWVVAKCEGKILTYHLVSTREGERKFASTDVDYCTEYSPSTNWLQAGPIIGQDKMIFCWGNEEGSEIYAGIKNSNFGSFGPTHLVAAMRCYVTSKFGDEVEIPEEL